MDLHAPVPPSSDGGYDLSNLVNSKLEFAVDPEAMPTDEVGNGPAVEAALTRADALAETAAAPTVTATPSPDPNPDPALTLSASEAQPPGETPGKPAEAAGPKLRRKKRVARKRSDVPAWLVSTMIHVGILGGLAAVATTSGEVVKRLANLDSSLVTNPGAAEELTKIYADPAEVRSDQAVGDPDSTVVGSGVGFSNSGGTAPSATPLVEPDRPARRRPDQHADHPHHRHPLGPRLDLGPAQPRPRRRWDGRRRRFFRRRRCGRGARPDRPRDPPPPHPAQGDRRLALRRVREHEGRPERDPQEVRPGRQRAQDQHARRPRPVPAQGQEGEVEHPADEPRHRRLRRTRSTSPSRSRRPTSRRSAGPSTSSRSTRPARRTP